MSYCLKCKKQTENKDEKIIKNRLSSKCVICDTNKSKFITLSQKGKGEIDQELSSAAYDATPQQNIKGYNYDADLSNKKTRVYHNPETGKTIISHKGTDPTDKKDLVNDALLSVGLLNRYTSKRVKKAEDVAKKTQAKYGDNISSTGHSLGGKLANITAQKLDVKNSKSEVYNSGSSPLEIIPNILNKAKCSVSNSNSCKKLKNQTENTTGVDPISISGALTSVGKTKLYKPKSANVHSIDNFKK